MISLLFFLVLSFYLIRRQWQMRNILKISRLLRSKYTAWPIVGHTLMFLRNAEGRMDTIKKFARAAIESEYGVTCFWIGTKFSVVTCDATLSEEVAKNCLGKSDLTYHMTKHLMGNAHIFAPVHIWRPRRKAITNAFSSKYLRYYVEVFAEHAATLTESLRPVADGRTFSIWKYFTAYTMNTVYETTLGIKMNVGTQSVHPFVAELNKYLEIVPALIALPSRNVELFFKYLPVYKEMENSKILIHNIVGDLIKKKQKLLQHENNNSKHNKALQNGAENSETKRGKRTFLEELMTAEDGNGFSAEELQEEALTLFIAGTDTISLSVSCATVLLSRNMHVQEKAYQEVYSIFGESKRLITFEDLPKLQYVDALIKETLRLYPPVPIINRENNVEITLASKIVLPVGTYTVINIWGLHRNPKYWGSDAEEFNPDRFLNGSVIERGAYIPFSYGPRNCIGYKYAMMSMKVILTSLLREYKVLPPSNLAPEDLKKPLRTEFKMMMKAGNSEVRLESRK